MCFGVCYLKIMLSVNLAAEMKKKLVLPDFQIYRTNQRLFNENKASLRIIMQWTKPVNIKCCHSCLNCAAATKHPSHTVSGTWHTAYNIIDSKVSQTEVPLCIWYIWRKLQQPTSNHVTMNHSDMSVCHLCEIIIKSKMWEWEIHDSVRCLMRKRHFLKLTVQETVWLQRCYLWCSIAFCRKKNTDKLFTIPAE